MEEPIIYHEEWVTEEPEVLEKFLTALFDWQSKRITPEYWIFQPSNQWISVGIMDSDRASSGGTPNVSVQINDIDSLFKRAEVLGGKVAVPKTGINGGWFAFLSAPDGSLIGIMDRQADQ